VKLCLHKMRVLLATNEWLIQINYLKRLQQQKISKIACCWYYSTISTKTKSTW
jgi:hypothetical protein